MKRQNINDNEIIKVLKYSNSNDYNGYQCLQLKDCEYEGNTVMKGRRVVMEGFGKMKYYYKEKNYVNYIGMFVGMFKDNRKCGFGVYVDYLDGEDKVNVQCGYWEDNVMGGISVNYVYNGKGNTVRKCVFADSVEDKGMAKGNSWVVEYDDNGKKVFSYKDKDVSVVISDFKQVVVNRNNSDVYDVYTLNINNEGIITIDNEYANVKEIQVLNEEQCILLPHYTMTTNNNNNDNNNSFIMNLINTIYTFDKENTMNNLHSTIMNTINNKPSDDKLNYIQTLTDKIISDLFNNKNL